MNTSQNTERNVLKKCSYNLLLLFRSHQLYYDQIWLTTSFEYFVARMIITIYMYVKFLKFFAHLIELYCIYILCVYALLYPYHNCCWYILAVVQYSLTTLLCIHWDKGSFLLQSKCAKSILQASIFVVGFLKGYLVVQGSWKQWKNS